MCVCVCVCVAINLVYYFNVDIAIGAPYESFSEENAQGSVYIYYGNRDTLISRSFDQVRICPLISSQKLCMYTVSI